MGAPAHPTTQLFLITMAEIKGNTLCNDQCFFSEVTVLLLFAFARPCLAHLDGREILVFELSCTKWMWALRRGTSLPLVLCSMIYSSRHMSVEVVYGRFTCADMCRVAPHLPVVSHSRRLLRHTCVREREEARDGGGGKKRKAYVWIEWHKKIIIAEDSLNRVGGKIPHFETIPAFQIVKLTFSAAVASERG